MSDISNTRYILFMVASMAGFAIEDAIIKKLAVDLPVSQVLMLVGALGALTFAVIAVPKGVVLFNGQMLSTKFVSRSFCELGAAVMFVTAFVYGSLSASSAILQATPLAVALGGSLFLKQRVQPRQWVLIVVGLVGVLIIIQPGSDGFEAASLLALGAVFFLAARDVITRSLASSVEPLAVSFWGFFSLLLAGACTIPFFGEFSGLTTDHYVLLTGSMIAGSLAYYAVVMATRGGDMAVIAPFRYSRLLFAVILAVIFFGETITLPVLIGSALIVASGLLTLRKA